MISVYYSRLNIPSGDYSENRDNNFYNYIVTSRFKYFEN